MKIMKIRLSMLEITKCFNEKSVKITKADIFMAEHDHFVLDDFFANFFACNEAYKNHKIQ